MPPGWPEDHCNNGLTTFRGSSKEKERKTTGIVELELGTQSLFLVFCFIGFCFIQFSYVLFV